ncbi:MAG: CDP-glycerol glycerophosphotransferase family protein [Lachnospiraceae bacterium]|nr:CDP-glycerol glycerophosphotransferase family protein [Lachnospiraceae bacterium]
MENQTKDKRLTATIVNISWERIIVHIELQLEFADDTLRGQNLDVYAVDQKLHARARFKQTVLGEDRLLLSMNVTNPGNRRCLPMGSYFFYVCLDDVILAKCTISPELVPEAENVSRSFLHNNRTRAYMANFFVTEGEDDLPLQLHIMDASKAGMELKTNREIVKSSMKDPVTRLRKNAGKMRWKAYYHQQVKQYWNKKNVIMFMTEQSDTLGSNLQAVYDRMCERGIADDYKIYISARPASYIKQDSSSTKKLLHRLAQCDMVFIDDHVPLFDWLKLASRTKVVQLWHAGAGFKSSGYSRWGHIGCPAPISCHRQYSYGIAGSRHIGKFFSEVFGINDEQILPTGMPRMDEYLDEDYRKAKTEELYRDYPMCKGKKVILFAPTYRGKNRKLAYYPYDMIDFDRLYDFCGDEYIVLFKMHPWVSEPVPIREEHQDRFIDVNLFPNINDLFYITEILITDYSSNIFEYSLMRKPMLFFAFDKIQYSFSRGFHRDYEEAAPGKVCYTFEEIMDALEQKDYEYEKVEEYVDQHFDYIDSHASDRVIDWILLGNIPEDIQEQLQQIRMINRRLRLMSFRSLKEQDE